MKSGKAQDERNVTFLLLKGKAEAVQHGKKRSPWGNLVDSAKRENCCSNRETTSRFPVVGKNGGESFNNQGL